MAKVCRDLESLGKFEEIWTGLEKFGGVRGRSGKFEKFGKIWGRGGLGRCREVWGSFRRSIGISILLRGQILSMESTTEQFSFFAFVL